MVKKGGKKSKVLVYILIILFVVAAISAVYISLQKSTNSNGYSPNISNNPLTGKVTIEIDLDQQDPGIVRWFKNLFNVPKNVIVIEKNSSE